VGKLSSEQLERWAADRARRAKVEMEPEAIRHLITAVGSDLAGIGLEIDKIAAAVPDGETVTVERVSEFVGVRRGETLVDWVEAVLRREPAKAVALLDVVLPQPGVNGVRMGMALGTAFLGTRWARAMVDAGMGPRQVSDQIFQRLRTSRFQNVGLWSDEAKRWTRAGQAWSAAEIDTAIAAVYEADRALKSSTLSDERAVLAALLLELPAGRAGTGVAA
jgi:DNA polymerase III delta subunit